jgi:hypothetical protein
MPTRLEFTEQEYISALSRVMEEAEASELARQLAQPLPKGTTATLSEGLLELLCAVSEEAALKVERYRRGAGHDPIP